MKHKESTIKMIIQESFVFWSIENTEVSDVILFFYKNIVKIRVRIGEAMINQERIIHEFIELTAIDAISFQEREIADVLKGKLEAIGFTVWEDEAGEAYGSSCGNLYGYLPGDILGDSLLFSAHMDTVMPGLGKRAVIQKDGRITSSGDTILGADDVSGLVAILEGIRSIREESLAHRSIEILFPVAEEVYAKGSRAFDYTKIRSKEAYVLDLSGKVGRAAYTAPSILSFQVLVKGRASHAGFCPEEGIHSIQIAARAIERMKLGRVDENSTVNIGIIKGGKATNIIPEECLIEGEIRSFHHGHGLRLLKEIKIIFEEEVAAAGASLVWEDEVNCVAYETDLKGSVAKRYQEACDMAGVPCEYVKTLGGSDHNNFAVHGLSGLVLANAMNQVHSCEEYTEVDELILITKIVRNLMLSKI